MSPVKLPVFLVRQISQENHRFHKRILSAFPAHIKVMFRLHLLSFFKVIYTPGHTIGSCCYEMTDYGVLFSGDTLFCESHGRYDFPTGSGRSIIKSIKERLMILPLDTRVLPGHNEATTIGDERKWYA